MLEVTSSISIHPLAFLAVHLEALGEIVIARKPNSSLALLAVLFFCCDTQGWIG